MAGRKVDVLREEGSAEQEQKHAFNFNTYATKKTIAKGLLDIGLLMANASQLKSLLSLGPAQDYYYANLVLISLSVFLQITVGIILLVLGSKNMKTVEEKKSANTLNNVTVGFVFAITVVNVFIAAFGIKLTEG
ncbi:ninjurin-2-like [Mercenaria mercenaria]|uniref:ninjurin-2-like n=1 Tax=Mercenaria mercenaria TaxID=6596 RepID=UPI001E1D7841|nr:ninjurin-2-like [Mercenaria mercenaria]